MAASLRAGARFDLQPVVDAFVEGEGEGVEIGAIGDGNINDTYLVRFRNRAPLVLQRLNGLVFPNPALVADNVALVAGHLRSKRNIDSSPCGSCRFPEAVASRAGRSCYRDSDGEFWRCLTYIDNSVVYPFVVSRRQPFEAGTVLGCFHFLLADFDLSLLAEPLPGFHDLAAYKDSYLQAVAGHRRQRSSELAYCRKMAEDRLHTVSLEQLAGEGNVESRVIHGDPKCDNFLFDRDSGRGISLIDLDTVSAGLAAVDLGDCLRSFCNPAGEKATTGVYFDIDICRQLLAGYRQSAPMSGAENRLVYQGAWQLTYELGLRFFTDYLVGDRYFKVAEKRENLHRAGVQFQLLESIETQRSAIEKAA